MPSKDNPVYKGLRNSEEIAHEEDKLMKESNAQRGYGEATMKSIDNLIDIFKDYGGLNDNSRFLDLVSGFGKVVFHVASKTKALSYGYEIVLPRYDACQIMKDELIR